MPFYLTPKQDDFNQELQVCIAEALYDVDSIVAEHLVSVVAPRTGPLLSVGAPARTRCRISRNRHWIVYTYSHAFLLHQD